MDKFSIGKGGKTPKQPPAAPQQKENGQSPADRAGKRLFSSKAKAPKADKAPKTAKAGGGLFSKKAPKADAAQPAAQPKPGAAQAKPAAAMKTAGKPAKAAAGGAAAGSNKSKIILLSILGVVLVGAVAFTLMNSGSSRQPVGVNPNMRRPMTGPAVPGARGPNIPGRNQVRGPNIPPRTQGQPGVGMNRQQASRPAPGQKQTIPELPKKQQQPVAAAKKEAPAEQIETPQRKPILSPAARKNIRQQARAQQPEQRRPQIPQTAKPAVQKRPKVAPVAAAPKAKPVVKQTPKPAPKPAAVSSKPAAKPAVAVAPAKKPVTKPATKKTTYPSVASKKVQPKTESVYIGRQSSDRIAESYSAPAAKTSTKSKAPATVQISALPYKGSKNTGKTYAHTSSGDLYSWPGGQSKGSSKTLFQEQAEPEVVVQKQEREKMMDEFASVKKLYMVLIKESADPEELRDYGRRMPYTTPPPEIKQTMSHGRQVYWLTVGHYTTADKAYNKAQELKSMGVETTVVSEKIYY